MNPDPAFLTAFEALPFGAYGANAFGRRYRVSKTQFACARSQKLEAEELGGSDYVSFNLYRLASGDCLLKPCEMSAEKVREFVMAVCPD